MSESSESQRLTAIEMLHWGKKKKKKTTEQSHYLVWVNVEERMASNATVKKKGKKVSLSLLVKRKVASCHIS